jgi:hypothetical protein
MDYDCALCRNPIPHTDGAAASYDRAICLPCVDTNFGEAYWQPFVKGLDGIPYCITSMIDGEVSEVILKQDRCPQCGIKHS